MKTHIIEIKGHYPTSEKNLGASRTREGAVFLTDYIRRNGRNVGRLHICEDGARLEELTSCCYAGFETAITRHQTNYEPQETEDICNECGSYCEPEYVEVCTDCGGLRHIEPDADMQIEICNCIGG